MKKSSIVRVERISRRSLESINKSINAAKTSRPVQQNPTSNVDSSRSGFAYSLPRSSSSPSDERGTTADTRIRIKPRTISPLSSKITIFDDKKRKDDKKEKKKATRLLCALIIIGLLTILAAITITLVLILLPKSSSIISSSPTQTTQTQTTSTTTAMVYQWNVTGTTVAGVSGTSGNSMTHLNLPYGIVIDSADTLYVSDYTNNRIMKYSSGASVGVIAVNSTGPMPCFSPGYLFIPQDVAVHTNSDIYALDTGCSRIRLMTAGATSAISYAGTFSGAGAHQFNSPKGIVIDSSTLTLYIADTNNHRVMRYTSGATNGTVVAGGNGAGTATNQLNLPQGLHFDSTSNSLIIANAGAHNVIKWSIGSTSWTLVAGSTSGASGNTATTFNRPTDVTMDNAGNVYVADYFNNRIQFFFNGQTNGTTVAGGSGGSGPNQLNGPVSVALDSRLNLYVSDNLNHRVQRYSRY